MSDASPARGAALRAAPAANPVPAESKAQANESPEAWLRRLAELKQQGKPKEFEESLAEFRKRYPAYRVPESLLLSR